MRAHTVFVIVLMACVTGAPLFYPAQGKPYNEAIFLEQLKDLRRQKAYESALELVRRHSRKIIQTFGVDHPKLGEAMNLAAEYHALKGDFARAERLSKLVIARFESAGAAADNVIKTAKTRLYLLQTARENPGTTKRSRRYLIESPKAQATKSSSDQSRSKDQVVSWQLESSAAIRQRNQKVQSNRTLSTKGTSTTEPNERLVSSLSRSNRPPPATVGPSIASSNEKCQLPHIKTSSSELGVARFKMDSRCHAQQVVKIRYGAHAFPHVVDESGRMSAKLDLFLGRARKIEFEFENGQRRAARLSAVEEAKMTKVAVIWASPVNLELHAFEYGAKFGSPGHVSTEQPRSADEVRKQVRDKGRGFGFLVGADASSEQQLQSAARIAVYTFLHAPQQKYGAVKMVLDYTSRGDVPSGDFCGNGRHASVKYDAYVLYPDGHVSHLAGEIPAAVCGRRLLQTARYMWAAVPDIRIRN